MTQTDTVMIVGTGSNLGMPDGQPYTFMYGNRLYTQAEAEKALRRLTSKPSRISYEIREARHPHKLVTSSRKPVAV